MPRKQKPKSAFDLTLFLTKADGEKSVSVYANNQLIFAQGGVADTVYYIQRGKVRLVVLSPQGKETVVALLGEGEFFGEGCLVGQAFRPESAVAMFRCLITKLSKSAIMRTLTEEPDFCERFVTHLVSRNLKTMEDLVDQRFNSSEKRLARILLSLATVSNEDKKTFLIPPISQETLAEIVGTTRSRINFFLNRFRRRGLIDYNGSLKIYPSRLNVVLR